MMPQVETVSRPPIRIVDLDQSRLVAVVISNTGYMVGLSLSVEFGMEHGENGAKPGFFASRTNIVLIAFLAIGGFYLVTEHWAHVIPYLPWLLLLACPFLHFFMHGGHGGHGDDQGPARNQSSDNQTPPHQH